MRLENIENVLVNIDKVESAIKVCIKELYNNESKKEDIASILEMIMDKLANIKKDLDKI